MANHETSILRDFSVESPKHYYDESRLRLFLVDRTDFA